MQEILVDHFITTRAEMKEQKDEDEDEKEEEEEEEEDATMSEDAKTMDQSKEKERFTLKQWMESTGKPPMSPEDYERFSKLVADMYRAKHGTDPPQMPEK